MRECEEYFRQKMEKKFGIPSYADKQYIEFRNEEHKISYFRAFGEFDISITFESRDHCFLPWGNRKSYKIKEDDIFSLKEILKKFSEYIKVKR